MVPPVGVRVEPVVVVPVRLGEVTEGVSLRAVPAVEVEPTAPRVAVLLGDEWTLLEPVTGAAEGRREGAVDVMDRLFSSSETDG